MGNCLDCGAAARVATQRTRFVSGAWLAHAHAFAVLRGGGALPTSPSPLTSSLPSALPLHVRQGDLMEVDGSIERELLGRLLTPEALRAAAAERARVAAAAASMASSREQGAGTGGSAAATAAAPSSPLGSQRRAGGSARRPRSLIGDLNQVPPHTHIQPTCLMGCTCPPSYYQPTLTPFLYSPPVPRRSRPGGQRRRGRWRCNRWRGISDGTCPAGAATNHPSHPSSRPCRICTAMGERCGSSDLRAQGDDGSLCQ